MFNMFFAGYFIRAAIENLIGGRYGTGIFFLAIGVINLIICWVEKETSKNDGGWI